MSGTEGEVHHRRWAREENTENENENETDDAAALITVLTALAGSAAAAAARPATASLWSVPAHRLQAAALAPGPSAWWASGLPR